MSRADHMLRLWITCAGQSTDSQQSASAVRNGWEEAAARLYLSHVLVGGQDDLVESRGRDLDSLLEGDGHHGSLIKDG